MRPFLKRAPFLFGFLAACNAATGPAMTAWQGAFNTDRSPDAIGGDVAVVSTNLLHASIQINNAPAGAILTWELRSGSCAQPGNILGGRAEYPAMSPGASGSAGAEAFVDATMRPDGRYEAAVLDTTRSVLACADLVRQ